MNRQAAQKYASPLNLLYFVLGLALLIILLLQVDFPSLVQSILAIRPEFLLLGGGIYFFKSLVRSFRFWRINARAKPSFIRMLRLTLASSLASQLMPLKLGELAYVYLVKKDFQSTLSQGISSLVVIRIFDLLSISILFTIALLGFGLPAGMSIYLYYILAFIAALIFGLFALVSGGKFLPALMSLLIEKTFLIKIPALVKFQNSIENILHELSQYRGKEYGELMAYPLLEWGANYAMYHILLVGMGFSPRLLHTITGVSFAALASVLPINSFGNFGTQEAGWATGLILSGFSQQAAITSGFATHLLSLAYMMVMGGIAWIAYLISYGIVPGARSQPSGSQSPDR